MHVERIINIHIFDVMEKKTSFIIKFISKNIF